MIEPTDEMREALREAKDEGCGYCIECLDGQVTAVLTIVERALRASIAEEIRRELVCCDVYERNHRSGMATDHAICYWGEAAARIAADQPDGES